MPATTAASAAPARLETLQLKIGGMSCSFCSSAIERALRRERGVAEVHVSLAHEEALVRFRPDLTDAARIQKTLQALGFIIRDPARLRPFEEQKELARAERNDLISAASFAVLLVLAMAAMWLGLWAMRDWHVWTAWAIASLVWFYNGRRILRMAWGAARRGITNQHVLVTAGCIGGYTGGVLGAPVPWLGWYGLVGFPAVDFFGVVVFLTAYHLLSGYVSLIVRTRASESVRRLLELQPATARVVRDGAEHEVAIEEVQIGDVVRIRPGERIPVDGTVLEGASAVDQSLVTGEPLPEDKAPGDPVIGGSINQDGTLLVRVERIGEDSFLRQVARHVEQAKAMKPGIVVLVDRVLRFYVPAVLLIALTALLFWGLIAPDSWSWWPSWVTAIYAGVTVLVMGYPCALGMATPLALIRGGGMAAQRGVLMRSGEAFQILKDVTHVVLDKTGTITEGRPRVVALEALAGVTDDDVLRLAASAEAPSEHPLGRAIVQSAEERGLELAEASDFRAVSGAGVTARVDRRAVLVGTARFLEAEVVDTSAAQARLVEHEAEARTAVLVAIDGRLAGVVAIADAIKPDAADAIAELRRQGRVPVMVTGDNRTTALAVARAVGIEQVEAPVLPQAKAHFVQALQDRGAVVAMVGDGINDAPALMQAHVGIAIAAVTDIAIESADVVIVGQRLSAVLEALAIGAMSYRKTVQNLWLAFFFNGVGVPVAATGMIHPAWAMGAMAASVSMVLANSFGGRLVARSRAPRLQPEAKPREAAPGSAIALFEVPRMHCAGCLATIRAALEGEPGIAKVEGDPARKTLAIAHDPARLTPARLVELLTEIGYPPQDR
jgi:P-type Cu+ transporter